MPYLVSRESKAATHTHTGPTPRTTRPEWVRQEWLDALPGMIADTVVEAREDMFDAVLCPGTQFDDYLANNRVVRRKGRVYVINKTQPRFKARQG